MSFILDALERSRHEREAGSGLSPAEEGRAAPEAIYPRVLVLFLALAFACALAVIAWLWTARTSQVAPAPESSTPASPPAALPAATVQPEMARTGSAAGSAISDLYSAARSQSGPPAEEAAPGADVPASGVSATPEAESGAEGAGAIDEAEVDAMVARAEAALDNRGLAAHPAPMLDELSQTFRDGIPTLMYSQHDYRANGGESSVFINRERRREGDSISGVRVQEILPESVVLSYRGTVFRLKALNSWVNL